MGFANEENQRMNATDGMSESFLGPDLEQLSARGFGGTRDTHRKTRAPFGWVLTSSEMFFDFVAILGALLFSYTLYHWLHLGKQIHYSTHIIAEVATGFAVVCVWILEWNGAYRRDGSLLLVRETERILRVSSEVFLAVLCLSSFTNHLVSRWVIVLAFIIVPLSLVVEKQLVAAAVYVLHSRGYGKRRVVIYGAGLTGRRIFSALLRSPKLGLEPVAIFDDESIPGTTIFEASYNHRRSATVSRGLPTRQILRQHGAQMIVIAIPSISREKFSLIATEALAAGTTISFVPHHFAPSDHWIDYMNLDGMLLASFEGPLRHRGYEVVKRIVDLILAALLLILLSPVFAMIAFIIRYTSPGSIFFTHERVGQNGNRFRMYKFRTMYEDAEPYAFCPTDASDHRVTKIGQFLRRTSLDELPQLANVIIGDMSMVGPRPEMPFIVEQYNTLQRERLTVKPGITGLWQLSADRKFLIHENIEYDLYYIRNRSFFMDAAILLHTIIFAMRGI